MLINLNENTIVNISEILYCCKWDCNLQDDDHKFQIIIKYKVDCLAQEVFFSSEQKRDSAFNYLISIVKRTAAHFYKDLIPPQNELNL